VHQNQTKKAAFEDGLLNFPRRYLFFIFSAGVLPDPIREGPLQEGVMLTVRELKPIDPAQVHRSDKTHSALQLRDNLSKVLY
jgi:hypothetical protein